MDIMFQPVDSTLGRPPGPLFSPLTFFSFSQHTISVIYRDFYQAHALLSAASLLVMVLASASSPNQSTYPDSSLIPKDVQTTSHHSIVNSPVGTRDLRENDPERERDREREGSLYSKGNIRPQPNRCNEDVIPSQEGTPLHPTSERGAANPPPFSWQTDGSKKKKSSCQFAGRAFYGF
ncbi:hypothetical protein POX_a01397 [Penicillium oxalicum]|uniref:hypothetical protein n=1 Tax=Penicillium oxalicum TaxID=69781 RepID=UPI0020B7FD74|nr:hypothetical protein POX_a01397 [Penicillium oxalicum]KAI2794796.1 hypothetical protein POX_a01397 [Penicillium oxalicum]